MMCTSFLSLFDGDWHPLGRKPSAKPPPFIPISSLTSGTKGSCWHICQHGGTVQGPSVSAPVCEQGYTWRSSLRVGLFHRGDPSNSEGASGRQWKRIFVRKIIDWLAN